MGGWAPRFSNRVSPPLEVKVEKTNDIMEAPLWGSITFEGEVTARVFIGLEMEGPY